MFDVVKKKRELIFSYIEGGGRMTSWDLTFKGFQIIVERNRLKSNEANGFLSANMKCVDNRY